MIERIHLFFKDQNKLAQAATVCFFLAVFATVYFMIRLPDDLIYKGGMVGSGRANMVYAKFFTVIGLAFAFCYLLIFLSHKIKKETIVYLDKQAGASEGKTNSSYESSNDFLSLNAIREKIKTGKTNERIQNGLNEFCNQIKAGQGAFYLVKKKADNKLLTLSSGFALFLAEGESNPEFNWGEGLIGQAAASGNSLYLDELPEGYATRIESGLGSALPKYLFIFPLKKENEVVGVIEAATFSPLSEANRKQALEAGKILAEIC
ncbi:MAG: GAF domain-containing protein [Bacteroidetes bacterium]|nr:GAF domain-containing protein [Bacteroidota bacterium]